MADDDIRGLLGSVQDYFVRGGLDEDARYILGPHAYEGLSKFASLANFLGPGADVKDIASESAGVMEGDPAAFVGLPAALAMMALPGSKSGVEEVTKNLKKSDDIDEVAEAMVSVMYEDTLKKYPDVQITREQFKENLKQTLKKWEADQEPTRYSDLSPETNRKAAEKFKQNKAGMEGLSAKQQARLIIENSKNANLPSVSVSKDGYVTGPDNKPLTLYHMTHSKDPFDEFDLTTEGRLPFLSTSTTPKGAEIGSAYNFRKELGDTGSRTIPMKARATRILDFEKPSDILEIIDYMKSNRPDKRDVELDDYFIEKVIDDMLQGRWETIETPRVREAMAAKGFDAFTTIEGGEKNVMLMDPVRQVEPLFDPTKTGMIGKYRRGGSVVERSNKHEPKAI